MRSWWDVLLGWPVRRKPNVVRALRKDRRTWQPRLK